MSVIQRIHTKSMIYANDVERIACSDICGRREQTGRGSVETVTLPYNYIGLGDHGGDAIWEPESYERLSNSLKAVNRAVSFQGIKMVVSLLSQNEMVVFPECDYADRRSYGLCKVTFRGSGLMRQACLPITSDLGERFYTSVFDEELAKVIQTIKLGEQQRIGLNLDVVVKSQSSGYFFHEIVGHCLEADIADIRSDKDISKTWAIGSPVSQCRLNIHDDPFASQYHRFGGYDDEGVTRHRTPLVTNDILTGYICNKHYAERFGLEECAGCSRRQSFRSEAIPRMSCTVVEIGDQDTTSKNTCGRPVSDGYFEVEQIIGGNMLVDSRAFRVICSGYLHRPGLAKAYSPSAIVSGDVEDSLMRIESIDDHLAPVEAPFFCFKKGQRVFVSAIAPSIVLRDVSVVGDFYVL